jgi:hypothetical protein
MANENDAAAGASPAAREEVLGGSVAGGEMISEKLYSPLVFYLHDPREEEESGEYGIYYLYDDRYQITHNEARKHIDAIELTLRRECDDLDKIHGLAEYLPDELRCNVWSMFPLIELHSDMLCFAAALKLTAPLSPEEMAELKDWWSGQLSDGFGEGLEQREIKVGREELYIVPWTSGDGFFVETEREFFQRLEPDSSESRQPMQRLTAKLDAELAEYHAKLLEKSKEEIVGLAFQAASVSDAYFALTEGHELTDAQIAALVAADSPLEDVAEVLRGGYNESMCMLDTGTLLEAAHISVPLLPEEAAPAVEPSSFREWKERWQEENKNRPPAPKKAPDHNRHDMGL